LRSAVRLKKWLGTTIDFLTSASINTVFCYGVQSPSSVRRYKIYTNLTFVPAVVNTVLRLLMMGSKSVRNL